MTLGRLKEIFPKEALLLLQELGALYEQSKDYPAYYARYVFRLWRTIPPDEQERINFHNIVFNPTELITKAQTMLDAGKRDIVCVQRWEKENKQVESA